MPASDGTASPQRSDRCGANGRALPSGNSETRTFAPARLHTTAAQTNPADSRRVGGAGTNCQEQDCRDGPQENSAHKR
jgi:hypothetical protein